TKEHNAERARASQRFKSRGNNIGGGDGDDESLQPNESIARVDTDAMQVDESTPRSRLTSLVEGRVSCVTSTVSPTPRSTDEADHNEYTLVTGNTPAPNKPTSTSRSTATFLLHTRSKTSKLLTSKINRRKTLSRCYKLLNRIKGQKWQLQNQPLRSPKSLAQLAKTELLRPFKRLSDVPDNPVTKRARSNPENTGTEPETDNNDDHNSRSHPKLPSRLPNPNHSAHPPPLTCVPTSSIVPEIRSSRSHTLGDSLSQYGESHPPLPNLLTPVCGPVHARLRAKLIERTLPDPGKSSNQEAELVLLLHPPARAEVDVSAPSRARGSRPANKQRLDPVLAARADMAAFSNACCRALKDLLSNEDELLAQVKAFAEQTTQKPTRSRRCNRKKSHSPAILMASDVSSAGNGLQWVRLIHEETFLIELPNVLSIVAAEEELEVMFNYLATFRGKAKDRLRPLVVEIHGFKYCVATQQDIQQNLDNFHLAHPTALNARKFQRSYSPRSGHYQSPNVPRMIGAALFCAPSSVGAQYPDYFVEMSLTVVAFILLCGDSAMTNGRTATPKVVTLVLRTGSTNTKPTVTG
ncbi:hypothetical protein FRC09_012810, partial [Ceratobasidium sp. 395]